MPRSTTHSPLHFSVPTLSAETGLDCHYSTLPVDQLLLSEQVLAVISSGTIPEHHTDPRHIHCGLTPLSQPLNEVWSTSGTVLKGTDSDLRWAQGEEMLFVAHSIDETHHSDQREAIYQAYTSLLAFLGSRGYPDIIRVWNYMPHINQGENDSERYRLFCLGRQQAFADSAYDVNTFPSACALGHSGDTTIIYLLAGKKPAIHIENPRQESAYKYPRQYGPASPSFARASLTDWADSSHLYISGTASILGHQSHHPHDLNGQIQTTFDNIDALLHHCATQAGMTETPRVSLLKIYIRNPADYPLVEERVRSRFPGIPVLYMQADICRRELLVEIDGLCNLAKAVVTTPALRAMENE